MIKINYFPSGSICYYNIYEALHRTNDLPAIIFVCGTKHYYENGKCHRTNDLPAIDHASGMRKYLLYGKLHRIDGLPAIEYSDGTKEYWRNGIHYSP